MRIETYIDSLVSYAMNRGLAEPVDHTVLTNRLLDLLRKDDYEPSDEPQTEDLQEILSTLAMTEDCGVVLRAKGMVPCSDCGHWLHFDLVPGEFEIREGGAEYTGRLCVIGSGLNEEMLAKLFAL